MNPLRALVNLSIVGTLVFSLWLMVVVVRVYFFDHNAMGPMSPIQEKDLWRITPKWIHPKPAVWTRAERLDWERRRKRRLKEQAEQQRRNRAKQKSLARNSADTEELVTPDEVAARAGMPQPTRQGRAKLPSHGGRSTTDTGSEGAKRRAAN